MLKTARHAAKSFRKRAIALAASRQPSAEVNKLLLFWLKSTDAAEAGREEVVVPKDEKASLY